MIIKYSEYKFQKIIESLILESKLELSRPFLKILNSISNNKIARDIIQLVNSGSDVNISQNYIDVSAEKDTATFIQTRKANQILNSKELKWITANNVSSKFFTLNKNESGEFKNKHIFDALGYEPKVDDNGKLIIWEPIQGVKGIIKGETISKKSGKVAVWFISDSGEEAIINKEAILPYDDNYEKLWTTNRSPIKIGRLVKSILTSSGISTTPKEIEEFVNAYKSTFDIVNNAFSKFKLVSGCEIEHWYNYENYESMTSTLGNSCMASKPSSFFHLYSKNDAVKLLILFSEGGEIIDGEYRSDKIKGRALVWQTDQGDIFMDRIYTNNDSDIDLFKQYAENYGWWYKSKQDSDNYFNVLNGKTQKSLVTYTVSLSNSDFDYYPYVDSLCYLSVSGRMISNSMGDIDAEYQLNSTLGYREDIDE